VEYHAEIALHFVEDRHVNIRRGRPNHADHGELACNRPGFPPQRNFLK
jgi:hypothetical protein